MSTEEIKSIKQQMELNHEEIMNQIKLLNEKVNPICNVYDSMQGFGSTVNWFAKYIFTPLIILLGAFVTYKKLQ
jgi:hypothetical protein